MRPGRFLTPSSLAWVVRHRAWTPYHLRSYWRFLLFRLRAPHVVCEGMVFLGRRVAVECRPGFGRIVLGRWVHLGSGTAIRCHEGSLRIGDKCVVGGRTTVDAYLDIEIGAASLIADGVYICDFDHRFDDREQPIKDQGIVKSPVRIGPDVWIGTKASVLRGASIGTGCVVAAHAVVTGTVPPHSVVAGAPARVVRSRARPPRQKDVVMRLGSVVINCTDLERMAAFWSAALGYAAQEPDGDFVRLDGPVGRSRVSLQVGHRPSPGQNTFHLDLYARDQRAEVARLLAMGATTTGRPTEPGQDFVVLADPEGNVFCVVDKSDGDGLD